jgi:hypothetical protein
MLRVVLTSGYDLRTKVSYSQKEEKEENRETEVKHFWKKRFSWQIAKAKSKR